MADDKDDKKDSGAQNKAGKGAADNAAAADGAPAKDKSSAAAKSATTPSAGKARASAKQTAKTEAGAKPLAAPQPEQTSAPDPEQAAPQKGQKSGSGRFAWTLVFLLLFFIGGVAATPYLLPQVVPLLPQQAKAYFAPVTASARASADTANLTAKLKQLDAGLKDVRQIATSSQQLLSAAPLASERPAGADMEALTARLEAMAAQLQQLSSAQADQSDAYARLQTSLEDIPSADGGGVSPAAIAGLKTRLEDASGARAAMADSVAALTAQVEALQSKASSKDAASSQALNDIAAALRDRLGSVEERLDVVAQAANTAAAPEALENVNASVTASLNEFKARLTALESVRQQATAAMVAGLETARLAQAVSNGKAYGAEIKALMQLKAQAGPAIPDIADLLSDIEPFAQTGIPSGATLSAQLEDRAREILTAIDTPDGANWWEQLLARIRNLVIVRKVGEGAQGSAPPDVLARAEIAARSGDWDAVVAEIGALPQSAKDGFGAWWEHAQARATAQRALADLSARLGVAVADGDEVAQAGASQ